MNREIWLFMISFLKPSYIYIYRYDKVYDITYYIFLFTIYIYIHVM